MGTVAEKLTYLNGTKSSLKTAINNLGGDITNETTFRQYANVLNDIYDNLPKVSYTGTNVSLSPTLKGRLGIVPKGNTYQESTTGKNLLPITLTTQTLNGVQITRNSDGSVTLNGTTTANTNFIWFEGSLSLEAGTYYIGLKTINNDMNLYLKNGGNTIIHQPMNVEYDTLTLESAKTYTSLRSYAVSGKTFNNETFYPMITKTLPFTYEPYTGGQASPNQDFPQEIQSATGTQKVVVSGKNLFSGDSSINFTKVTTIHLDKPLPAGTYTCSAIITSSDTDGTSNLIQFRSNASGTQNRGLYLGRNIRNSAATTITFEANYIAFYSSTSYANSDGDTATIIDMQIEKGSTATPYQPYQEPQEVDIELGNIELNKIGDYEDYIDGTPDNWVLYKNLATHTIEASDIGTLSSYWLSSHGVYGAGVLKTSLGLGYVSIDRSSFSSIAKKINAIANITENTYMFNGNPGYVFFFSSKFDTLEKAKEMLSGGVIVYNPDTPTTTPITEEPLVSQLNELYYLQSYNDTTNIDVTGNLPMRITASAIKGA